MTSCQPEHPAAAPEIASHAAARGQSGPSNSRSAFTYSTFGVDTCSLRFHGLLGSHAAQALDVAPSLPHGHRGRLLADRHQSGARALWFPEVGTLKVEGRLAALVDGRKESKRLGTRAELRELPDLAVKVARDLAGIDAAELRAERHSVARLDLTGELRFDDAADGFAFLKATAGLTPPGYKTKVISANTGQPETVYTITGRRGRNVARFYDSGSHHGTDEPGRLIRYEVANQLPSRARVTPAELAVTPDALPNMYARHLSHFVDHTRSLTVTTAQDAPQQIARLIAEGAITPRQASGLAGFAAMLPYGARHLYTDQSARRYLRLLRRHGVVLTGTEQEAALTIGQALDALLTGAVEASEAQEVARVA